MSINVLNKLPFCVSDGRSRVFLEYCIRNSLLVRSPLNFNRSIDQWMYFLNNIYILIHFQLVLDDCVRNNFIMYPKKSSIFTYNSFHLKKCLVLLLMLQTHYILKGHPCHAFKTMLAVCKECTTLAEELIFLRTQIYRIMCSV